ncbi:MAG: AmmeMemoRadiSam system protein B [Desulfuromonadales bacterium]|nr:AmmeMemoRadiSam system protein B [Desulfuromonadales bacterium]
MVRQPLVAGLFYPSNPSELRRQLLQFMAPEESQQSAKAVVLPHAGYIYSGAVAAEVVRQVVVPRQVILLGPNHHGHGESIAVSAAKGWHTPLGTISIADGLRNHLLTCLPGLVTDDLPHRDEHSLEVLLPFLQYRQPELEIVPIALNHQLDEDDCMQLGNALAQAISNWSQPLLLVASSDMNHFLPAQLNTQLDALAISAMTAFDPRRLYQVVRDNRISMCGVLPVVTTMYAAQILGAKQCQLVRYAHSGESSGDNSRVVGYAGLIMN